ncbi:MAG: response regulator transcription factor [Desulfuromonadaceae bacterium]|nr:response regulator transcription factor [Desulfuromonadaceae bacterium]
MDSPRILVAEDDLHIREGLIDILEGEGYGVLAAADGEAALSLSNTHRFDLALLDIMMPKRNGYDVCRELRRQHPQLAIIMLTAKGEEIDKVLGLELGADDYITKPFGVHELRARIAAVLRRSQRTPLETEAILPPTLTMGLAIIHRKTYRGNLNNCTFKLTAKEMKLLEAFYRHPDEALQRQTLLNLAWGIDYQGTTRTLDQHIAQLRKKIELDPTTPQTITTVHGIGYRYEPC